MSGQQILTKMQFNGEKIFFSTNGAGASVFTGMKGTSVFTGMKRNLYSQVLTQDGS